MSDSFFQKPIGVASLIGSAIVGPYVYFGGVEVPPGLHARTVQPADAPAGYPAGYAEAPSLYRSPTVSNVAPSDSAIRTGPTLSNAPVSDFREVLRFDITPAWVTQHFSRVTTLLADTSFDGVRVSFVSGTQPTDVAGSLTYYFDARHTVRRIQLIGVCGDPAILANLMLQYYYLRAEPSLGGHLYTSRWNGRVTSILHVSPAPVIHSQDAHARYRVFLELNQPTMDYALTPEAEQILQSAHLSQH